MNMNWKILVEERNEWVAHNFPVVHVSPPGESLIGCIEEVGELAHAHLKGMQSIRGTADEHVINGKDAIGDLIIYLLGVMSNVGIPDVIPPSVPPQSTADALLRLSNAVGVLCMSPSQLRVERVLYYAKHYCKLRLWDFTAIVHDTWREVKKRDWIKYPETGLPSTPAITTPSGEEIG